MKCRVNNDTQNTNARVNHCLWETYPKTEFVGLTTNSLGVTGAITCLNERSSATINVLEQNKQETWKAYGRRLENNLPLKEENETS